MFAATLVLGVLASGTAQRSILSTAVLFLAAGFVAGPAAVDAVHLDFGKPTQRRLGCIDVAEAERHLADGQFPAGSMGPKVRAAVQFVRRGGRVCVITTASSVLATLDNGDTAADESLGTRIMAVTETEGAGS